MLVYELETSESPLAWTKSVVLTLGVVRTAASPRRPAPRYAANNCSAVYRTFQDMCSRQQPKEDTPDVQDLPVCSPYLCRNAFVVVTREPGIFLPIHSDVGRIKSESCPSDSGCS